MQVLLVNHNRIVNGYPVSVRDGNLRIDNTLVGSVSTHQDGLQVRLPDFRTFSGVDLGDLVRAVLAHQEAEHELLAV